MAHTEMLAAYPNELGDIDKGLLNDQGTSDYAA